ncbi:MAG TPA: helix-turn-helix transcriptional regulator [Rugosimonospora sp.]|nr:helix-turn-helix transcriptional regulator [Rugosimonospora sp.]
MTDLVTRTGWVADDSTLGARLALIRQRMQWGNVKEAADECGIPVENWRRWERDGRTPRDVVDQAEKISERTGCDLDWLIRGPKPQRRRVPETVTSGEPTRPTGRRDPVRPWTPGRPVPLRRVA